MNIIINYLIVELNKFYLIFNFLFQSYKYLLLVIMVQRNKIYFKVTISKVSAI